MSSYIPTYVPTYIPIYIPTYIPIYLYTYIPTYLPTYIYYRSSISFYGDYYLGFERLIKEKGVTLHRGSKLLISSIPNNLLIV